jgi:hypothetical protein
VTRARERLSAASDVLLDAEAPPFALAAAARDLHALLSEITGLGEGAAASRLDESTRLPSGLALSPRAAARALDDFVRTARFAQGLEAAVAQAAARFGSPVEVLYAGCGPFAALCLPLLARAAPVRVTLLDLHAGSLESVARVVAACGLEEAVRACERGDATRYRHPRPLHVALTETMGQALEREPQVAVAANLSAQLSPGGILVPERVQVDACLADPAREFAQGEQPPARPRVELGAVLVLDAESAGGIAAGAPPVVLEVPTLGPDDPACLMLRTTVGIQGGTALREYESGITYPKFIHELGRLRVGQRLRIAYRAGSDPGFDCGLLRPAAGGAGV